MLKYYVKMYKPIFGIGSVWILLIEVDLIYHEMKLVNVAFEACF